MTATGPPPAILFDLDGTLVDTDAYHFRSYQAVLFNALPGLNSGEPITRSFYDAEMSGKQNRSIMRELAPHLPEASRTAIWEEKERLYYEYISGGVAPIPGLVPFLDAIDSNIYSIRKCVVTNAPRVMAAKTLAALSLEHRFEAYPMVIGEECARPKPAPEPYLDGIKAVAGAAHRTIAFEDSPSGIAAAKAAGLFTVAVMSSRDRDELRSVGADACIKDYTDPELWHIVSKQLKLDE